MKTNFYEDEFSEQMILEKSLHEQKLTFNSLINKNTENFHFIFFCLTDVFQKQCTQSHTKLTVLY